MGTLAFIASCIMRGELPTGHPRLLRSVIACKKSVNFHINLWAEGFSDCLMPMEEYMAEFKNPPEWVFAAFSGAKRRALYAAYQATKSRAA